MKSKRPSKHFRLKTPGKSPAGCSTILKWDQQIDRDIAAGRLDKLWEKAKADIAAGRVKSLDEIIRHSLTKPVGRIRRGGYIITWFIGDHKPRHVHVETRNGKLIGRFNLDTRRGMEDWQPDKKLLRIIAELERERRL